MAALDRGLVVAVVLCGATGLASWGCHQSSSAGSGTGGSANPPGDASGSGGAPSSDAAPNGDTGNGDGSIPSSTGGTTGSGGASSGASGGSADGQAGASTGGTKGSTGGGSGGLAGGGANGLAGHTGAGGAGQGGRGSGTASGGASAGSSCSSAALPAGNSNKTIQIGSVTRSYILHVPSGYSGTKPVPLVLDFHALGGTGSQEQSSSGYQAIADKQGFIILFPDGIDNAWNIGPCCTNSPDVDDLGFARGMVTATISQACIDTTRVYATGFSMGGGMCQYLACNAADVFAAVAPSSFDLLVPDEEPCAPSRPISVLAYRGTADTTVPYAGGPGPNGRITFLGAQGSFQRWASIDGCATASTTDGDCTYQSMCDAGVEIGLCVKQGGGHAPGDANVGWAFLSRFTLP